MLSSLPATTQRVPLHTSDEWNARIRAATDANVARHAAQGGPAIERRLQELEHEWDIERTLEANASSLMLLGLGLGALVDRRFLILPALVGGFLLQHAVQGWCPPVGLFRRFGVRTASEIDHERYALKVLRGDFERVQPRGDVWQGDGPERVMQAVRS